MHWQSNIIQLYGEKGTQWITELPNLIAKVEECYGLSDLNPAPNLSYNYVLFGLQDSKPIVLKLGLDMEGLKREATALRAFESFGAVPVLSENDGVLLVERASPGTSLKSYFPDKEQESIGIATKVIERLHQAPISKHHAFPCIKDWLEALEGQLAIPKHYLEKARQLRDHLLNTTDKEVLLHGDLHHDNILQNNQDWIVIDPKGVIGDPIYEVAAFIRNPIPELLAHENALDIIQNRITRFSKELACPEQRILDWCFVQAVLSWVWALEDLSNVSYFKKLTEVFWSMLHVR